MCVRPPVTVSRSLLSPPRAVRRVRKVLTPFTPHTRPHSCLPPPPLGRSNRILIPLETAKRRNLIGNAFAQNQLASLGVYGDSFELREDAISY